jgi:hypothetical protein
VRNIELMEANKNLIRVVYGLISGCGNGDDAADVWTGGGDRGQDVIGYVPATKPENDPIAVFGSLREFEMASEYYVEEWTVEHNTRGLATEKRVESVHHTVPEHVSWEANRWVKDYLFGEHGLELTFDDGSDLETWSDISLEEERAMYQDGKVLVAEDPDDLPGQDEVLGDAEEDGEEVAG